MSSDADLREPGYCAACGEFHLLTPVPGPPGAGICGNCEQAGRLGLPPGPDRPRYTPRVSLRQQRRIQRTAAQFWSYGDDGEDSSPGAFFTGRRGWRLLAYWLRRREAR